MSFIELLLLVCIGLIIVVVVLALLIYRGLKRQQSGMPYLKPIYSPNYDVEGEIETSKEVQERINKQADEALKLLSQFQKFVPKQFIEHFIRGGLDSLELGHAIETKVSIMFCDIRGFTSLAENMKPRELMTFLNSYFYRMNDPIHENKGFIDKFIGDAIMALFDQEAGEKANSAYSAIKASVEIYKALEIYNAQRAKSGYQQIEIAIGLHYGNVVVGTVGSDDRMDTTVIGDAVNVAERIEKLSSSYEADILVSEHLLRKAKTGGSFCYRFVDRLRIRGRQQSIDVYEIFDHVSRKDKEKKQQVAKFIEKGVMHRIKFEWAEAIQCFEEAIKISPQDRLAFYHLKRAIELKNAHREMHNDENIGFLL